MRSPPMSRRSPARMTSAWPALTDPTADGSSWSTLCKQFDDVVAVDDIDLDIEPGEFFSLLGPSGCGKTTTLRMIAGFEQPTSGQILLDGQDLVAVPPHRRPVNTVFQSYALFPHLNVEDNVAFGLRWRRDNGRGRQGERRRRRSARPSSWCASAGLEQRRPAQLSGGQQQRVALARALVLQPEGAAARRAARRPRRQAAQGPPGRPGGAAARGRDHVRLRHPRPGGGADDVAPAGRHGRRPGRPGRARRSTSTSSRRRRTWPTSSAWPTCSTPTGEPADGGRGACASGRSPSTPAATAPPAR